MNLKSVIKQPILTEKSNWQLAENKYAFRVSKRASKFQIAQAIEKFFGVKVAGVKVITLRGKKHRVQGMRGRQTKGADWKKALVQLKPGEKLDLFEAAATEAVPAKKE